MSLKNTAKTHSNSTRGDNFLLPEMCQVEFGGLSDLRIKTLTTVLKNYIRQSAWEWNLRSSIQRPEYLSMIETNLTQDSLQIRVLF